jgi:hypothetical protein
MRVLKPKEIVQLLRTEVKTAGSQRAWAKKAGIERPLVNKILRGRKQPTEKIILALGLRRVLQQRADIQKLRPTKELDVEGILRLLRAEVQRAGSQMAFAKIAGVDRATVQRFSAVCCRHLQKSCTPSACAWWCSYQNRNRRVTLANMRANVSGSRMPTNLADR